MTPLARAYDVVLKTGAVIHFQKYRLSGNQLFYVAESRKEVSVPLSDINLAATREKNENANPPLATPGLYPAPLGDIARNLNGKPETNPEGYVFTDDDFPSWPAEGEPANVAAGRVPVKVSH
jgi:hypothetical protein